MTKIGKISLLIFILSIILPFISYKIKGPSFLNSFEMTLAKFQEPSLVEFTEKKGRVEFELGDPFKISERLKKSHKLDMTKSLDSSNLSLIYHGQKRYVMFGNNIIGEGDRIGDFRIVKILSDRVLISDKKGETKWLKLENY